MLLNYNYYNLFRLDRITKTHGGGILIYMNSLFPAHTLQFTDNFKLINLLMFDYTIIVIYRTPSMSYNDTVKLFDLISKLTDTIETCIIHVDLNLPGIDWSNSSAISLVEKYVYSFTQNHALIQLVNFPIRKSNILDLILTNDIRTISSISPISSIEYNNHCSDHVSMISFILYPSNYYKVNSKSCNQKSSPNYIKSDYDSIKYDLSIINWDYLLESANDSSDMLSIFIEKLLLIYNNHTPPTKFRKYKYPS